MAQHDWKEGTIVGYHPPEKVPIGIGPSKPRMRYECASCGRVVHGDGGSGMLVWSLTDDTCPGSKTDKIAVDRNDLLDLIMCSEHYGFADSTLLSAFGGWLKDNGGLTDAQIEQFAQTMYTDARRYSEEDRDNARQALQAFRARYMKSEPKTCPGAT